MFSDADTLPKRTYIWLDFVVVVVVYITLKFIVGNQRSTVNHQPKHRNLLKFMLISHAKLNRAILYVCKNVEAPSW